MFSALTPRSRVKTRQARERYASEVGLSRPPPHGSKQGFDCDGKADIDMTTVAINCLPVSQETKEHRKE